MACSSLKIQNVGTIRSEKGFNVKGQILGEGFKTANVKICSFETKASNLSDFNFGEIPGGKYDLTLKTNEKEILIEEIELV